MANHKPKAPAVDDHFWDVKAAATGNILSTASDPDGDLLHVAFVNGQRVNMTQDKFGHYQPLVIKGEYGTLTMYANGSYSYQLFDSLALTLAPGESITEKFSFKITDGKGGTDFDYLKIHYDIPPAGEYTIDFESSTPGEPLPNNYKGFTFGSEMDSSNWYSGLEGENHVATSDPFDPFFYRADHKDFIVKDVAIATFFDPDYFGTDADVTFIGWRDGNQVSSLDVCVWGDTIADGQVISLESLGKVDYVSYEIRPLTDVDVGYPLLAFDNMTVLV